LLPAVSVPTVEAVVMVASLGVDVSADQRRLVTGGARARARLTFPAGLGPAGPASSKVDEAHPAASFDAALSSER
jgi:hypothetical protein